MCVKRHRAVCLNAAETALPVTAWTPVSGGKNPRESSDFRLARAASPAGKKGLQPLSRQKDALGKWRVPAHRQIGLESHTLWYRPVWTGKGGLICQEVYLKRKKKGKEKKKKYPLKYCLLPRGKDIFLDWTPKDVGLSEDVRTNSVFLWDCLPRTKSHSNQLSKRGLILKTQ